MSVKTVMASASTISPKVIAAGIFATVSPYVLDTLLKFRDTGVIDVANLRGILYGLVTGLLAAVAGYLALPGQTVDVPVTDNGYLGDDSSAL